MSVKKGMTTLIIVVAASFVIRSMGAAFAGDREDILFVQKMCQQVAEVHGKNVKCSSLSSAILHTLDKDREFTVLAAKESVNLSRAMQVSHSDHSFDLMIAPLAAVDGTSKHLLALYSPSDRTFLRMIIQEVTKASSDAGATLSLSMLPMAPGFWH